MKFRFRGYYTIEEDNTTISVVQRHSNPLLISIEGVQW